MPQITLDQLLVLIVEPSNTQAKIITKALQNIGITNPFHCQSGKQAIHILIQEKPDLIISAFYLEDMDGSELVHKIRHLKDNSDTAFMLISSETRFRYLDPIRQAGAVGILPKPFAQKELLAALHATVDLVDPEQSMHGVDTENLHVLVVDDSNLARKHIGRVLASMGINKITQATDGIRALKQINQHYFDFIVTDYNMPNMDGKELIDNIRSHSNQSSIPILMVTSEDNDARLAAIQNCGVSAICDKPFEPNTVRQLVAQFVNTSNQE